MIPPNSSFSAPKLPQSAKERDPSRKLFSQERLQVQQPEHPCSPGARPLALGFSSPQRAGRGASKPGAALCLSFPSGTRRRRKPSESPSPAEEPAPGTRFMPCALSLPR